MRIFAILLLGLSTCAPANAEPPALPDGLSTGITIPCTDDETGKQGHCTVYAGDNGTGWMVFRRLGRVEFIRFTEPGQPYVTVWHRDDTY